jgi:hypothetical protein
MNMIDLDMIFRRCNDDEKRAMWIAASSIRESDHVEWMRQFFANYESLQQFNPKHRRSLSEI